MAEGGETFEDLSPRPEHLEGLDEQGRRLLEDPADAPPWPDSDLALRDGAEAFWAPQRCGR